MQRIAIIIIFVVAVIATAVYFLNSNNKQNPKANVTPTPVSEANETSEMVDDPSGAGQEQALQAVRIAVAEQAGIEVEMVDIIYADPKEWPDGCLGSPSGDEMCTQVITPGYEIKAEAQGQTYTYRTNSDGTLLKED